MRESGWTVLPELVVDPTNDLPPPIGEDTLGASVEFVTETSDVSISYFPEDPPSGVTGVASGAAELGAEYAGHYWPGIEGGGWDVDPAEPPSPPRTLGPIGYNSIPGSFSGASAGRYSFDDRTWLLFDYNVISFRKSYAIGRLTIPTNDDLSDYLGVAVNTGFPDFAGDNSWAWAEANTADRTAVVLPSSVTLELDIDANAGRTGGTLTCYVAWLEPGADYLEPEWSSGGPGAPWSVGGSMSYGTSGGWSAMSLDLSGIAPAVATGDYTNGYKIALLFVSDQAFVEPSIGGDEDGPYDGTVSWSNSRVALSYDQVLSYRYIGPQNIDGGADVLGTFFAVVNDENGSRILSVTPSAPAIVHDIVEWPVAGTDGYDVEAVSRGAGLVGNEATLLIRDSANSQLVSLNIVTNASGTISYVSLGVPTSALGYGGLFPTGYGGNEGPWVLLSRWTGAAYSYRLLNQVFGLTYAVTGIYPGSGGDEVNTTAVFTRGYTDFIVDHGIESRDGNYGIRLQRYTLTDTGAATPTGPQMEMLDLGSEYLYWSDVSEGDIWDVEGYVGVGFMAERTDGATALVLVVFDNTSTGPRWIIELYRDQRADLWDTGPTSIAFAKAKSGYLVSYCRNVLTPIAGSLRSTDWFTVVTRTIDMETGVLGSETFIQDTNYADITVGSDLLRFDGGSRMVYIGSEHPTATPNPTKVTLANPGAGGSIDIGPWYGADFGEHPEGDIVPLLWIATKYGNWGRLHYKQKYEDGVERWVPVCGSGAKLYHNNPISGAWEAVCPGSEGATPIYAKDPHTGVWIELCCEHNPPPAG